jgi:DNA-binding NtrC family response regulator
MTSPHVLIVDADRRDATGIEATLKTEGYSTALARCGEEALSIMERRTTFLVLSEIVLPRMDGLALLKEAKARWPEVPFIILTVIRDMVTIVRAMRAGAQNYLTKPLRRAALLSAVAEVRQEKEVHRATSHAPGRMVGESKAMAAIYKMIAVAQWNNFNVLLTGETGTGKELVAYAIHNGSDRQGKSLVIHNCARAGHELFESAFFGHVRGAFTGAVENRAGLLERAHGSHLFLDELENLSLDHQGETLRAIEDGEARRVGSSEGRKVSVRYLSATNRDLRELMAAKLFRDDLYFRLKGYEIHLPPLRERAGDIPLLVKYFLEDFAGKVTGEAMSALGGYHWPGNVRELRNILEAAKGLAVVRGDARIDRGDLAICEPGIVEDRCAEDGPALANGLQGHQSTLGSNGGGYLVYGTNLLDVERQVMSKALADGGGKLTFAARALGIDRTTLWRRLRAHGLDVRI